MDQLNPVLPAWSELVWGMFSIVAVAIPVALAVTAFIILKIVREIRDELKAHK
ncbi:MAG: hypothetical protein KGL77_05265 [Actinomycetales bacterium]|nr:hypothetical protein [Actinomycetales bacterium]